MRKAVYLRDNTPKDMINLNVEKLNQKQWISFIIVLFGIAPFVFSFIVLEQTIFKDYTSLISIITLSVFFQIPILMICMPLYYLSNKIRKPEKKSETEYEFSIKTYRTVHFFMSSFFTSGFVGSIFFLACLIFNLSFSYFILGLFGYLILRLLLDAVIYIIRN